MIFVVLNIIVAVQIMLMITMELVKIPVLFKLNFHSLRFKINGSLADLTAKRYELNR